MVCGQRRHRPGDSVASLLEQLAGPVQSQLIQDWVGAARPVAHAKMDCEPAGLIEAFVALLMQHAVLLPDFGLVGERLGQVDLRHVAPQGTVAAGGQAVM